MLAYVFWHWPTPGVDVGRYVEALLEFHRALAAAPSPGLRGSRVLTVERAPWTPVEHAFEDWYLVDDFAALGALNEAAVSGKRREPHDGAARLAAGGVAGVYGRLSAGSRPSNQETWLSKPPGMSYADLAARLPAAETWQRQMVLGPTPEFCLLGGGTPPGIEGRTLAVQVLYEGP